MSLPDRQCRLWVGQAPAERRDDDHALLSPDERAACERLATPALRVRYARGHALLRQALADTLGGRPEAWALERGHNGRPGLSESRAGVDFNLSYSGDLVACALVRDARVGIDLEVIDDEFDYSGILARVMSPSERRWLGELPEAAARRAFYGTWVLKEALSKAVGEGLGLAFNEFSLRPGPGGRTTADLEGIGASRSDWQFEQCRVGEDAVLALAIHAPGIADRPFDLQPVHVPGSSGHSPAISRAT